jgi:hypothetical protein
MADNMKELIAKVEQMKKSGTVDLSTEEDLSIAIMNLVSLEEHFFFTAEKTGKREYFDLLAETREIRKGLLGRMMTQNEGETWCISKHLLAASMRVMEVATKLNGEGNKDEAKKLFDTSYKIYSMFWALRLKLINVDGIKKISEDAINVHDEKGTKKPWSFEDIVGKLVNCCDE